MEPLLLVCSGCGAKIRAADPNKARTRDCPRCATLLRSAVEEAILIKAKGVDPPPGHPVDKIALTEPIGNDERPSVVIPRSKARSHLIVLGVALFGALSIRNLLVSSVAPPTGESAGFGSIRTMPAVRALTWTPQIDSDPRPEVAAPPATELDEGTGEDPATKKPDPPSVSVSDSPANFAIRDAEVPSISPLSPPSVSPTAPAHFKPVFPSTTTPSDLRMVADPEKIPAPPTPAQPRRLLVRDPKGTAVVAREHGFLKDQMAVVLPDGTIGWPDTQVFTEAPFVPSTIDEMERTLLDGEYAAFRVVKTKHYLVFYQSSDRFARDSANLLEELHKKLAEVLEKKDLPVTPAEFPLVAVIFRSEEDFRSNRNVAADVQAYYEILSNRIFFFEKSRKESASPEVSALRKPQTVAHEGTHQVLHNIGIQPRMSPWPLWLVEGLAEYCSPPKTTKRGVAWAGLGQINPMHLTTIRDLEDPMSSEVRGGPKAPTARDRGRPLVEYLATRSDLTPTDYALSWGLTHYLAQNRVDQFVSYIRKLNKLRPFENRTPDEQLADFRETFGQDLAKLDAQVGRYLAKLKIPEAQALPFYAVLLEQQVSPNAIRRMAMVSQSPSVIRQWVETASNSGGGEVHWEGVPCPNRTRAVLTADGWVHQGR